MKFGIIISIFFLLNACQKQVQVQNTPEETQKMETEFELKGKWVLDYMSPVNNKDVSQLFQIQKPYLTFVDPTKVAGNNGCNNIAGTYSIDGKSIKFDTEKFSSTKMFCEGADETAFLSVLQTINGYSIIKDGKVLILRTSDIISMQFKKVED